MTKWIAVAALIIAASAQAQVPQQNTFTYSGTAEQHTYSTFALLTFDGQSATGSVETDLTIGSFNLPNAVLVDCPGSQTTVTGAYPGGFSITTTGNYACTGYAVTTVKTVNYKYTGCSGRGGGYRRCYTDNFPGSHPDGLGTVTAE